MHSFQHSPVASLIRDMASRRIRYTASSLAFCIRPRFVMRQMVYAYIVDGAFTAGVKVCLTGDVKGHPAPRCTVQI